MNVRTSKHIGILPLTKKQVNPKNSSAGYCFLFCKRPASYEQFSILTRENKKAFTRTETDPVNIYRLTI